MASSRKNLNTMKTKNDQKLLLQVSIIVMVLFFGAALMFVISEYFTVRSSLLSSKNEMIDRDLLDVYDLSFDLKHMKWMVDTLEAHPEYAETGQDPVLNEALSKVNNSWYYIDGYFNLKTLNPAETSPEVQMIIATEAVSVFDSGLRYNSLHYDRASLIDVMNEKERLFINKCGLRN